MHQNHLTRHCEERFFASLPQHELSRGGNLELIDLFNGKIEELIPSHKARLLRLRLAMIAKKALPPYLVRVLVLVVVAALVFVGAAFIGAAFNWTGPPVGSPSGPDRYCAKSAGGRAGLK
jgi:hypothetical protein